MKTFNTLADFAAAFKAHASSKDEEKKNEALSICAVTGIKGKPGVDVKPAIVMVTMGNGSNDKFRILIHKSVRAGRKFKGGTIKSVNRKNVTAKATLRHDGSVFVAIA